MSSQGSAAFSCLPGRPHDVRRCVLLLAGMCQGRSQQGRQPPGMRCAWKPQHSRGWKALAGPRGEARMLVWTPELPPADGEEPHKPLTPEPDCAYIFTALI